MEKKGLGSKLLGVFVETEGDARGKDEHPSPADVIAELAQPKGEPASASGLAIDKLQVAPGPARDFDAVFRDAGMDGGELDRVKKAQELLKGLPEATPQPIKKQIVEASLKAFGFELDKIVTAATNQQRALDTYVRLNETATAKSISDAEQQIRTFNEKITSLRQNIQERTAALAQLSSAAQVRKAEVQKVIEFFQGPPATGPSHS